MAIAQSVQAGSPRPGLYVSKTGTSLSGTTQQTTSLSSISPTFHAGKVRVHIDTLAGTSPVITSVIIKVTDGSTPYFIFSAATTGIASVGVDYTTEFQVETACNEIDVLTTMSGTSPTANLDFEAVLQN